jgi:hypothetical protein
VLRRIHTILTHNWLLKITALGLAFLLWSVVKADNRVSIENVPIQVVNRDGDWVLSQRPDPPHRHRGERAHDANRAVAR